MDAAATKFRMSDGDWVCSDPHCANINFARRNKCNRCNKDRAEGSVKKKLGQEIGKALADKSRGLFSADDWQCNKCGNVNWARRQQCNMCNAPKFGEVEERTGYGGGYNDRGTVEYIEREESDSEYDEYGRRKRKKSSGSKNDDREGNGPSKRDEDEEDDEEDDGDEDDLSKYDLSGWGDDSEDQIARDIKGRSNDRESRKTSRSHSRSRSRSRSPTRSKRD